MRTTLARGKADRVPMAFIGDPDFYAKAAGRPLWELEYGDNEAVMEIMRDAFLRFPYNDHCHCWGYDYATVASRRLVTVDGEPYVEDTATGERTAVRARKTASRWGEPGYDDPTSNWGLNPPVRTEADIARVLGPVSTKEEMLASGAFDVMKALRRDLGEEAYITTGGEGTFWTAVGMMGGFDDGLLALRDHPGVFRSLVEQMTERQCARLEAAASAGADGAFVGAFLEGADIISPESWREVALPGHRILVERAHSLGLQVLMWFLGDCMPLLEDFVELGIDGLWLEQDRRGYRADPIEVRERIGDAMCVWGWNWELDLINDNRRGLTEQVERQIRGAGTDGAFVMGTTYLTSEARLEALDHYCEEVVRVSREVGY